MEKWEIHVLPAGGIIDHTIRLRYTKQNSCGLEFQMPCVLHFMHSATPSKEVRIFTFCEVLLLPTWVIHMHVCNEGLLCHLSHSHNICNTSRAEMQHFYPRGKYVSDMLHLVTSTLPLQHILHFNRPTLQNFGKARAYHNSTERQTQYLSRRSNTAGQATLGAG